MDDECDKRFPWVKKEIIIRKCDVSLRGLQNEALGVWTGQIPLGYTGGLP
jgi:hypothetical protein